MKKLVAAMMILVASTTALVGCGTEKTNTEVNSNTEAAVEKAPLEELLNQMVEGGAVRMPMPVDETLAQEAYHIDLEVVEEYAIAQTGISPGPGLIVMVKAKEGQLDQAKANMEALLEAQVGNAFYPAEQEAAEKAEIMVEGNYVALFILNDEVKESTVKMFTESTK